MILVIKLNYRRINIPVYKGLEIGITGGQFIILILKTYCNLTAIEQGVNYALLCRDKFINYPRFSVINDKYDNVYIDDSRCDLVYDGSAIHWVLEKIDYRKYTQA